MSADQIGLYITVKLEWHVMQQKPSVVLQALFMLIALNSGLTASYVVASEPKALLLEDKTRQRNIPVDIYLPAAEHECHEASSCHVAIVSPGYGSHYNEYKSYSFIASKLNQMGYLVAIVQHQLASDPKLATGKNLFKRRIPNWNQGVENLRYLKTALSFRYPTFDWKHLTLVGHSNGGDISAWAFRSSSTFADNLVTLDHRRVPLPRIDGVKVLSIRASDYPADLGVLPSEKEKKQFDICVEAIEGAKHNDMHDGGPQQLRKSIQNMIEHFLVSNRCSNKDL